MVEARNLGVTSYIGVLDDHTIRRFDPRRTPTRPFMMPGTRVPQVVSDGEIVATLVNL